MTLSGMPAELEELMNSDCLPESYIPVMCAGPIAPTMYVSPAEVEDMFAVEPFPVDQTTGSGLFPAFSVDETMGSGLFPAFSVDETMGSGLCPPFPATPTYLSVSSASPSEPSTPQQAVFSQPGTPGMPMGPHHLDFFGADFGNEASPASTDSCLSPPEVLTPSEMSRYRALLDAADESSSSLAIAPPSYWNGVGSTTASQADWAWQHRCLMMAQGRADPIPADGSGLHSKLTMDDLFDFSKYDHEHPAAESVEVGFPKVPTPLPGVEAMLGEPASELALPPLAPRTDGFDQGLPSPTFIENQARVQEQNRMEAVRRVNAISFQIPTEPASPSGPDSLMGGTQD